MNIKNRVIYTLKKENSIKSLLLLLKAKKNSRKIYDKTSWSKKKNNETSLAKRLSFLTALYVDLVKRKGEKKAFQIIHNIIIPIGIDEMKKLLEDEPDPMERLFAFYTSIRRNGVGKFVNREIVKADNSCLEYRVRNCLFVRFFAETGTPELARLFCKVDEEFFPKAFTEFIFTRGKSFQNSQAYGKDFCEFKFKLRETIHS